MQIERDGLHEQMDGQTHGQTGPFRDREIYRWTDVSKQLTDRQNLLTRLTDDQINRFRDQESDDVTDIERRIG
jgi:hypothetical protein